MSPYECSILIALPLFDINESENEIVKEICYYIKNKAHCIPPDEQKNIIIGMYLNIVEYIDKNEQEKLMEDINMEAETEGIFVQFKREQFNEGAKSIVDYLLEKHTLEEVANFAEMPVSDILDIINK